MNRKSIPGILLMVSLLAGCSRALSSEPLPTMSASTQFVLPTFTLPAPAAGGGGAATLTLPTSAFVTMEPTSIAISTLPASSQPAVTPVGGVTPVAGAAFCADPQPVTLIDNLKTALQTADGKLLASLVSPAHGMEVRYYRDGRTVTYDQAHARFLFESTFEVEWGNAPGSGLPTKGSFHDVVVPALLKTFAQSYTTACNQLQVGGTTYTAQWPYPNVNYYSVYYPGTAANGNMDWHTVVVGMENVNGKTYIHSLVQFEWEP
ncbi:MAG TPA: hypothetical protein VIU39_00040 [Anaerolineales bacterium]